MIDLVVKNASQILTCIVKDVDPPYGGRHAGSIGLTSGGVAIENGRILEVGPDAEKLEANQVIDAEGAKNEAYMANFTPEQLEFFYSFPAWLVAFWAIAVWGGLIGAIFLLLRKRLAVPVLSASLVCMVVTAIHNYGFSNALEILGTFGAVFTLVIFIVALALLLYARAIAERGVLT